MPHSRAFTRRSNLLAPTRRGDTIEAMHDGVLVTNDRSVAIRFSSLAACPMLLPIEAPANAARGLSNTAATFMPAFNGRTLSFLQDALDCPSPMPIRRRNDTVTP